MGKSMIVKIVSAAVLLGADIHAATLEIYQDSVRYRYIPVDTYIGFAENVTARCLEKRVSLSAHVDCPEEKRLCKERKRVDMLQTEADSLRYSLSSLQGIMKKIKPTAVEADKWIDAAEKTGKKRAELVEAAKKAKAELARAKRHFLSQTSAVKALFADEKCNGELELTLPGGTVTVRLINEADLSGNGNIKIIHYLALKNRSGIDISAKDARIYARNSRLYLQPIHFTPWKVRPRRAKSGELKYVKRRLPEAKPSLAGAVMKEDAAPAPMIENVVKTGYKNYAIGKLELPSTGTEIRVKTAEYTAATVCENTVYPYRDRQVYVACRFTPSETIAEHRWLLKKNRRIISENAFGEYEKGKYLLYTDVDDTIKVERRRIVESDRSSGIFGGSIKKSDGFVLRITNLSKKVKSLKIVERIPRSVTDRIKVKLLTITGAEKESLDEEGKLTMKLSLSPGEHKEIKVLFQLKYDKDLEISY